MKVFYRNCIKMGIGAALGFIAFNETVDFYDSFTTAIIAKIKDHKEKRRENGDIDDYGKKLKAEIAYLEEKIFGDKSSDEE